MQFKYSLMKDNWRTLNCTISYKGIELSMKGTPIEKISSFENANRRIFMSATLTDNSPFVSTIGLKEEDIIDNIIRPEQADNIGDRMILSPQVLNTEIKDEEIKENIKKYKENYNIVVIVPSFERAKFWDDDGDSKILKKEDIVEAQIANST